MSSGARSLVYVHGTGVREDAYNESFAIIERQLAMSLPGCQPIRCLWGDSAGCKLLSGGKSIPEYETSRDMFGAEEDPSYVLWWMLYQDPLFEIESFPAEHSDQLSLGEENAAESAVHLLTRRESQEALSAVEAAGLSEVWDSTRDELARSADLVTALRRFPFFTAELRTALARAVVARALQLTSQRLVLPGDERDKLVAVLAASWGSEERALGWVQNALGRMALSLGTNKAKRKRGTLSDAAYPAAGDILLYQRRGDEIRKEIRAPIDAAAQPVAVLAHSLGGIACVDLLCHADAPKVEWLITVGSQAPLLYELDALEGIRHPDPLPDCFAAHWINIYDLRDFLSYVAEDVFDDKRVTDIKVNNRQPFPHSHSAYWKNQDVWNAIVTKLRPV